MSSPPPRKPPRISLSSSLQSLSPGRGRKPPPPPSPTTAAPSSPTLYSPLQKGPKGKTTKLAYDDEEEEEEVEEEEEEEKGWRLQEEMEGSRGSIHTRHVQLQALVEKRVLNLDYLRRTHAGKREGGGKKKKEEKERDLPIHSFTHPSFHSFIHSLPLASTHPPTHPPTTKKEEPTGSTQSFSRKTLFGST